MRIEIRDLLSSFLGTHYYIKSYNDNTSAGVSIPEITAELGCTIRDIRLKESIEGFINDGRLTIDTIARCLRC